MSVLRRTALLAGCCALLLPACVGGLGSGEARQLAIEDKIVSIFENSTPLIQYAFIANLNDGRGYTAGRAGFTSGTGDLLEVVKVYQSLASDNVLVKYLPALLLVSGSDSVAGLEALPQDWALAAGDARFVAAQDSVNERLYRQPARQLAALLGLRLPLSRLAIYEAGIQHGYGEDSDSVNRIAERASAAVAGAPAKGVDEKKWLQAFLTERRKTLLNPADQATAAGWAASVSRADAIQSLYNTGNFKLDGPIAITVYGDSFSF
jgi:chitosanase